MPGAQFVTVIASARRTGAVSKVSKVGETLICAVIVVARGRMQAGHQPAPGPIEALAVLDGLALIVGIITCGENLTGQTCQQLRRPVIAVLPADGDIARPRQHHRLGCGSQGGSTRRGGDGGRCKGGRRGEAGGNGRSRRGRNRRGSGWQGGWCTTRQKEQEHDPEDPSSVHEGYYSRKGKKGGNAPTILLCPLKTAGKGFTPLLRGETLRMLLFLHRVQPWFKVAASLPLRTPGSHTTHQR